MNNIKAQFPAPGLSHDGKWAGLACVVAGYGYVVCVETRGIYWRIERPGVFTGVLRWLMSEVRQSRPDSPGQRAQERAQVMSLTNTQATHKHHSLSQNITTKHSGKACISSKLQDFRAVVSSLIPHCQKLCSTKYLSWEIEIKLSKLLS